MIALDDHQADDRQMELFQGTTSEKISQHKIDGIEYSEFAHLSTDRPDEVRRDGDGKKLTERRVKSYGFFKNEYYDDWTHPMVDIRHTDDVHHDGISVDNGLELSEENSNGLFCWYQ